MKKLIVLVCLMGMVTLGAANAMAENIAGRLGITGRLGFINPATSDAGDFKLETDAAFLGGGGLIYGIDRHFAAEIDVTRSKFGSNKVSGADTGDFGITNISLGAQYRFDIAHPRWVPFVGAGLDILLNDYNRGSVDNTVGVHFSGGVDYFFMKQLAATAEIKVVVAPEADINSSPFGTGHFDPSSFSSTLGIRYFFY